MTPDERSTLIHAELDDDLSSEQRAELAHLLLADPQARAFRDELHALTGRLEKLAQLEPPAELKDSILASLPAKAATPLAATYRTAAFSRWRLAALLAGVLTAGAIVYETMQGPVPTSRETAGTMAADAATTLDSVPVSGGLVTGRATLYRDKTGLSIGLDVSTAEPVDVVITTGSSSFRIKGLSSTDRPQGARRTIAVPGVGVRGQEIELSFEIGDRKVGQAMLRAPFGPDA